MNGGGGAANVLRLLPLNFRSRWHGSFAVWEFSVVKRLQCGVIAASTGASGRSNTGNCADLFVVVIAVMLVVVLVVILPLPLAVVVVIFGFRKLQNKGLGRMDFAAITKSLWASSRSSQKINDGTF